MNYELFLAKRFTAAKQHKSSISSPIIKIAITAISLGIVMMLVTVATGLGLQNKIREKISVFRGHIQIINYDNNNSETTQIPISKNQEFYPNFKNIEGVKKVQVFASKAGIIRTEKDFEGVVLKGVGEDYNWESLQEYLVAGKLPVFTDKLSNEILISEVISDRLGLVTGDKFDTYFMKDSGVSRFNRRVFTVCGIYNSGFQEFDQSIVIGDIKHIRKLNKWKDDEVGGFEVVLADFDRLEEKSNLIYSEISSTLNSQSILEMYPSIFEWLRLFDTNIYIIIAIMILVAGINMITALLVLILERTQAIGVLKALGANNWSVRKIFLYNASYLIARGLFWGNTIGLSLLFVQKYFGVITLDPATYYVSEAPVYIHLGYVLLLNVGTLVLCLLMLLIPSYIITKISPAKAVKFE
ncbi:ABC transporter permease [Flavicella sediminum]|uniref:ABC transporter permease n=1 Tax=Flavicella sediminum TaxID=2585141 RepID=UPI00111CB274|nr:FtsX-like permease family protein [Flavicella sediminum]